MSEPFTGQTSPAADTGADTGPDTGADTGADTGPDPGTTGHPLVDQVLASLAALEDRPAAEHVEVFEAAHDRLRDALADISPEPGGTPAPA